MFKNILQQKNKTKAYFFENVWRFNFCFIPFNALINMTQVIVHIKPINR